MNSKTLGGGSRNVPVTIGQSRSGNMQVYPEVVLQDEGERLNDESVIVSTKNLDRDKRTSIFPEIQTSPASFMNKMAATVSFTTPSGAAATAAAAEKAVKGMGSKI